MVDKEVYEIAINHIDKKLKERIDELTAQRDTFIKLMDLYRSLSKGRKDVKQVVDYINSLELYKEVVEKIEQLLDDNLVVTHSEIRNIISKVKDKEQC